MMFQDARLLPWKTVIDNVRGRGLRRAWRDAALCRRDGASDRTRRCRAQEQAFGRAVGCGGMARAAASGSGGTKNEGFIPTGTSR